VFALRLKELPLRETVRAADAAEGLALPADVRSADEIERVVSALTARESRREVYARLARQAGVDLPPIACWLLYRINEFRPATVACLLDQLPIQRPALEHWLSWLGDRELITREPASDGAETTIQFTPDGAQVFERLVRARRERLETLLAGWSPARHAELEDLVTRLARVLVPDVA
jgi:DNA-binding MarR family transcriptional regulator